MPLPPPSWASNTSGPTSGTASRKQPAYTEQQVVKLAGRLIAKDPYNSSLTQDRLGNVFTGYSPGKVNRLGQRVGLSGTVLQGLVNRAKAEQSPASGLPGEGFLGGIGTILWALNRPGQAVLGGISEGGGGVKKGFLGQEEYTPVQAYARGIEGQSKQQAAQSEKSLGGWATPLNIAGSAATDPLTYLSFGTTAVGRAAATRASELTGVAAGDLLKQGTRALTEDQLKAIAEAGGQRLVRALKGAPGGVKVAGRTVINTRRLTGGVGEKLGRAYEASPLSRVGDVAEAAFRNESAVRQAARGGEEWAQGVAPQLQGVFAASRGRYGLMGDEALATARLALRSNRLSKRNFATLRDVLDVNPPATILAARQAGGAKDFRQILDETLGAERAAGVQTPYLGQGSVQSLEARLNAQGDNPILAAIRREKDPTLADPLLLKAQQQETDLARQYFPHVPENPTNYQKTYGSPGLFGAKQPGFTTQRKLEGSIADINRKVDQGILGPEARMQPDLAKAVVHRQLSSAAAINRQQTLDDLLAIKGGDGAAIFQPAKGTAPKGMTEVAVPGVGPGATPTKFHVRDEIAGDVQRHFQNISSEETATSLLKLMDQYNKFWKRYAVATPGFISRNVQSNLYAASFLPERGFRATLIDYVQAGIIQHKVRQGLEESGDAFAKLSAKEAQRYRAASGSGALQGGFVGADKAVRGPVTTRLRDELRVGNIGEVAKRTARRANPLGPDFLPTSALRTANTTFEDNARLALFLHNQKALGDQGSARLVFKYLFDHNDLTSFEQNALKRVSPFMTWTRKNVPLQLETLLKNPGRFSRIEQVREEVGRQAGPIQNQPIPSYISDQGGVKFPGTLPFGMGKEGVITPDLPYRSAYESLAPLVKVLQSIPSGELNGRELGQLVSANTGGASGLLTGLIEAAAGRNLFTGQTFTPGARTDSIFGKINPATLNLIEKAVPIAQRGKALFPASAADEKNQTRRLLSALLGVPLTPLNASTRRSALLERLAQLQQTQRTLKDTGQAIPDLKDVPGYKTPKKSTKSSGLPAPSWSK